MKSKLSRRDTLKLMGLGAAAVGASGLGLNALARTSPATSESIAFYRFKIGDITATAIHDGTFVFPTAVWGSNVAPEDVYELLKEHNLEPEMVTLPNINLLLDTPTERILIDTGLGRYVFPGDTRNSGKLLPTLDLLGISRDSIDTVFITHGHPDHIGALTDVNGQPNFRNARHLIHQKDWDFWMGDAPADDPFTQMFFQVAAENLTPLADRFETFDTEVELVPGIRTVEMFGHTPGQTGLLIESAGEKVMSMADVASHQIISFKRPSWLVGVDVDPEGSAATKERILEVAAAERIKLFGDHHSFPGLGFVARDTAKKEWVLTPEG